MTIRERLLSQTLVYKAFKNLLLPPASLRRITEEMFAADDGASVLDLGCGYGDYAPWFAGRCRYLGIDHNPGYLETARRRNAHLGHGQLAPEFICADVSDPVVAERGPYDLIFLGGVLHHLDDDQVRTLASQVAPLLTEKGRFVALEPVFDPDQRLTARLLIASDRGRYVRDAAGYAALLGTALPHVSSEVYGDLLRVPYSHLLIEARPQTEARPGVPAGDRL